MKYLLDSDTFITCKNGCYRFDTFPKFWEWLEQENILHMVGSVDAVRRELTTEDQLANWVKLQGSRFFVAVDGPANKSLAQIAQWVNGHRNFSDAAKQEFFSAADFVVIGYAHAHNCTVVTFEKDEPDSVRKIKIPTVCKQFGIKCVNVYQMLSDLKAKFYRLKGISN